MGGQFLNQASSGAVGTISNSCAAVAAFPGFHSYVHIIAKGMTLALHLGNGLTVLKPGGERQDLPEEVDPNFEMNKAFVEAVRTGNRDNIRCPYDEGMRTFELTYAAHLSTAERRLVRIGEDYP